MTNSNFTNTMHSFQFEGDDAMEKMQLILKMFRYGFRSIGGLKVVEVLDYSRGMEGLPESDVIQYRLEGGSAIILKPAAAEAILNVYISVTGDSPESAAAIEKSVCEDLESIVFMDDRMGYCCE